jgi:phenylpropionate dioxygenase-like ring-hydroxylating dioxygenase large terminal subunit
MMGRPEKYPFSIPRGWFRVAFQDALSPGEVNALHLFGRQLILITTESGEVGLLDAHCPHLGAHLGKGGVVVGESIRCPFHAWRFGLGGELLEIPYSKQKPARARLRRYPTAVRNGIVWAWYCPRAGEPTWDPPEIPELSDPGWSELVHHRWLIRTRNQEIAENTSDSAHFRTVHGFGDAPEPEVSFEEHRCRSVTISRVPKASGELAASRLEVTWHGLGLGVVRSTGAFELLVVGTNTPVDESAVDARFSFSVSRARGLRPDSGPGRAFIAEAIRQMEQDIPIWENKIYAPRPVLCDGDGPIGAFRDWAKQFYAEP